MVGCDTPPYRGERLMLALAYDGEPVPWADPVSFELAPTWPLTNQGPVSWTVPGQPRRRFGRAPRARTLRVNGFVVMTEVGRTLTRAFHAPGCGPIDAVQTDEDVIYDLPAHGVRWQMY